jgi:hypothetical protein
LAYKTEATIGDAIEKLSMAGSPKAKEQVRAF